MCQWVGYLDVRSERMVDAGGWHACVCAVCVSVCVVCVCGWVA